MKTGDNPPNLIAVMGPTGSGKTELAERLADLIGARLINSDASQAYIGLDIGTAKPKNRERYALLDVKHPSESFGVGEWVSLARQELERNWNLGLSTIVVGGTGLYVRALFEEYDNLANAPSIELRENLRSRLISDGLDVLVNELEERDFALASKTDLKNPARVLRALERIAEVPLPQQSLPLFRKTKIGLSPPSSLLDDRLRERVRVMFQDGWVKEVGTLVQQGILANAPGMRAIGYSEIARGLEGAYSEEELVQTIFLRTRQYSKRQRTWMRSEPNLYMLESSHDIDLAVAEAIRVIGIQAKG